MRPNLHLSQRMVGEFILGDPYYSCDWECSTFISEAPADTVIYLANGGAILPEANVTVTEGLPLPRR
ncbi:MAG: hypothetical protein IPN76_06795 [Saprospiraceae bacterium]|nr:hypothetical protein [Saprospiraceae bacterium]